MKRIGCFELRISLFNALGLAMATGVPTYLDPRLTSHILWQNRSYFLGYWVLVLAPFLFIGSIACFQYVRAWNARVWGPSTLLVFAGLGSLLNFRPEFPHANVTAWVLLFALASFGASLIHYLPVKDDFLKSSEIRKNLKVDKIKEMGALWRAFAVTVTATYAGLLIPWYAYYMTSTSRLVSEPTEALILKLCLCGEVAVFSLWMLVGPILESWSKAAVVSDLILHVPEDAA